MAPQKIMEALFCESSNLWTESGIDIGKVEELKFLNDLDLDDHNIVFQRIEDNTDELLKKNNRIISLGGDHSITYPIIKAYSRSYENLNIFHFDAHPDLYDEFDGNRFSHACPFARIMEENLAGHLVQIGVRGLNTHQMEQAKRFNVDTIDMRAWPKKPALRVKGPVYLSLDMDVLDPACAPGVSHPEGGGLMTRDVIDIIQNLPGPLIGADLVEYNPNHDMTGITDVAAAKLMKEILARLLES